ncbi:MAG: hypothetical protein JST47_03575 [Bacteroidetes bacterium]|nr:hypothetical protein [Bacteroidota bacterium]
MKIAVIACYYGKLPWYFKYFLYSCSYNLTIDFFIITDERTYDIQHPKNVHFIYKELNQINALASKKLGFPVAIKRGYKFCDFKPAYGFLFPEIIEGCDFWGYGDIDVVYGNIRNFISNELMKVYDLISIRPDWAPGCFLLFKNCKKMNTLFMQSKDYKKVFSNGRHYCFDETNFQHDAFTEGKKYYEIPSKIESMMHVIRRLEEKDYIYPYFEFFIIEGRPGKLKWEKGTLIYKNEFEAILYHLIKLKEVYHPKRSPKKIPEKFYISPTRIYS